MSSAGVILFASVFRLWETDGTARTTDEVEIRTGSGDGGDDKLGQIDSG